MFLWEWVDLIISALFQRYFSGIGLDNGKPIFHKGWRSNPEPDIPIILMVINGTCAR